MDKMARTRERRLMLLIGIFCLVTPVACLLLGLIGAKTGVNTPGWWLSVSAAYYNNTAPIMIGLLVLTGSFMMIYSSAYNGADRWLLISQGILCYLIVLFPTLPEDDRLYVGIFCVPKMASFVLHTIFSIVLFGLFGTMCCFRFCKSSGTQSGSEKTKKNWRNVLYKTCGIIIYVSTGLLFILGAFDLFIWHGFAYVMLCEFFMLTAYSVAWIVKSLYHV